MKVQDILTDESKWTQGYYARDKDNHLVSVDSPNACKFCLIGAMLKAYPEAAEKDAVETTTFRKLGSGVANWNDAPERTFAEVRALIEELDI